MTNFKNVPQIKHPKITDIQTVLDVYWANPEIGNAEIRRIFGISEKSTYSTQLKRQVADAQAVNDIPVFTCGTVNTKFA